MAAPQKQAEWIGETSDTFSIARTRDTANPPPHVRRCFEFAFDGENCDEQRSYVKQ